MPARHLGTMFADAAEKHAGRPATRVAVPDGAEVRTYADIARDVTRLAARLVADGLASGDRVAIFSTNRPEWTVVDLACATAGLVSVPLYATSTPEQVRHIVRDSGCRVAFVAGEHEAATIASVRAELPDLERVVTFDDDVADCTSLETELALAPDSRDGVDQRLASTSADDLATIIYTSGTTGEPKGVMLTHRGFLHQIDVLNAYFDITRYDTSLCFLPLSHALERAWTYVVLSNGALNTYVTDPRTVAESLVRFRPNLLVSVPRLYEKVVVGAKEKVAGSRVKSAIFAWALSVGSRYQRAATSSVGPALRLQHAVADRLVLHSIREAVGGPKKVLACGGAPLRQDIEEFFLACGLLVLQGYGLTEASPLVSFPSPDSYRFGTVGRVIDGAEVTLGPEDEIWYSGPNVMQGYWNKPEDTAAVLVDGWLRTGDVGKVDEDGFLRITDRIKDLIVTSNGKNIAPSSIEGLLATDPVFETTLLLGDNRPYLTLLVAPSMPSLEAIGRQLQLTWERREDLLSHPDLVAELRRRVVALTARLAKHEQVRDLRLLIDEFTQENGLLTPTLKVKRKEVEHRFKAIVEEMYEKAGRPRG